MPVTVTSATTTWLQRPPLCACSNCTCAAPAGVDLISFLDASGDWVLAFEGSEDEGNPDYRIYAVTTHLYFRLQTNIGDPIPTGVSFPFQWEGGAAHLTYDGEDLFSPSFPLLDDDVGYSVPAGWRQEVASFTSVMAYDVGSGILVDAPLPGEGDPGYDTLALATDPPDWYPDTPTWSYCLDPWLVPLPAGF